MEVLLWDVIAVFIVEHFQCLVPVSFLVVVISRRHFPVVDFHIMDMSGGSELVFKGKFRFFQFLEWFRLQQGSLVIEVLCKRLLLGRCVLQRFNPELHRSRIGFDNTQASSSFLIFLF